MYVRIDAEQDPLIASSSSTVMAAYETSQIIYLNFAESSDVFHFIHTKKILRVDEK